MSGTCFVPLVCKNPRRVATVLGRIARGGGEQGAVCVRAGGLAAVGGVGVVLVRSCYFVVPLVRLRRGNRCRWSCVSRYRRRCHLRLQGIVGRWCHVVPAMTVGAPMMQVALVGACLDGGGV